MKVSVSRLETGWNGLNKNIGNLAGFQPGQIRAYFVKVSVSRKQPGTDGEGKSNPGMEGLNLGGGEVRSQKSKRKREKETVGAKKTHG